MIKKRGNKVSVVAITMRTGRSNHIGVEHEMDQTPQIVIEVTIGRVDFGEAAVMPYHESEMLRRLTKRLRDALGPLGVMKVDLEIVSHGRLADGGNFGVRAYRDRVADKLLCDAARSLLDAVLDEWRASPGFPPTAGDIESGQSS